MSDDADFIETRLLKVVLGMLNFCAASLAPPQSFTTLSIFSRYICHTLVSILLLFYLSLVKYCNF
jgi:hypothetical protein